MVARLAVLFDCDNTLLDNDAAKEEFDRRLQASVGPGETSRFWSVYEEVRADRTVVDIPATIERFSEDREIRAALTRVFFDFPFADYVFPSVPRVIEHARAMGPVAILSDGDQSFQRHKIKRSGLEALVDGAVYVFDHKEAAVAQVTGEVKAERYVTVDDKPRLLVALKSAMAVPLTTVFVRQGNYAAVREIEPSTDFTLESIADFLKLTEADLLGVSGA